MSLFNISILEEKCLKKHYLCYKREVRNATPKAVTDICVINTSKGDVVPPQYTTVR